MTGSTVATPVSVPVPANKRTFCVRLTFPPPMEPEPRTVFAQRPWLLDNEDPSVALSVVVDLLQRPRDTSYTRTFFHQKVVALAWCSNVLEQTLPLGASEHATYAELLELARTPAVVERGEVELCWHVDGGGSGGVTQVAVSLHQLRQYVIAASSLLAKACQPLTVDVVLACHDSLMMGAVRDDGSPVTSGFRTGPCHAGDHSYPDGDPPRLRMELESIVARFEAVVSQHSFATSHVGSSLDPVPSGERVVAAVTTSVLLFYEVITLHPFENGNGRLCRLLFAFALMRFGIPFPVVLSSGHSKARSHYMKAIFAARRLRAGRMGELNSMALMSLERTLTNFYSNLAVSG